MESASQKGNAKDLNNNSPIPSWIKPKGGLFKESDPYFL